MEKWHPVAQAADVEEGLALTITVAGQSLLLIRNGNSFHVVTDKCSHADQELACGIVRNGWIACPAHGTRFDLESGAPLNPPAREPIATFPVRVLDGQLEVCLTAES